VPDMGAARAVHGKGIHSSTSQLNLSRSCERGTLKLPDMSLKKCSLQADECKPLVHGRRGAHGGLRGQTPITARHVIQNTCKLSFVELIPSHVLTSVYPSLACARYSYIVQYTVRPSFVGLHGIS